MSPEKTPNIVRKNNDGSYTKEYRDFLIAKMMEPGGPSANSLAETSGVSQPTLSRWLREYKKKKGLLKPKNPTIPPDIQEALSNEGLMVVIVPRKSEKVEDTPRVVTGLEF